MSPKTFENVIQEYSNRIIKNYPFDNINDLLKNLRKDFGALPYTDELIGLGQNQVHHENVDQHVLSVVNILKDSSELSSIRF
jgi:hypothetical protein